MIQCLRSYKKKQGISFGGVGNLYRYNHIKNLPHTCINGNGNNLVFEYNLVENGCFEATDAGGFYAGRSWASLGNVLRYNEFRDIKTTELTFTVPATVYAIYFDDQLAGKLSRCQNVSQL